MQSLVRHCMPPASPVPGGDPKRSASHSSTLQLSIHRPAAFPLFQHEHAQSAVQPLVDITEDSRRVRESEVRLPAHQIAPQLRHDLPEAARRWRLYLLGWLLHLVPVTLPASAITSSDV